ncbi:MAG: hypothetical protein ACLT63_20055 [Bacteroides xylanisolvens]
MGFAAHDFINNENCEFSHALCLAENGFTMRQPEYRYHQTAAGKYKLEVNAPMATGYGATKSIP